MYNSNPNLIQNLRYGLKYAVAKFRGHNYYTGPYHNWVQAQQCSSGYDDRHILEKAVQTQNQVVAGKATYERDTRLFYREAYNDQLLKVIDMASTAQSDSALNIIDFGGALGSSYFQHRKALNALGAFCWNVIEQEIFVDKGQQLYQSSELKFYKEVTEIEHYSSAQLLILSSVLQYLEDPFTLLGKIAEIRPLFIFIDRTPFIENPQSLISVQHVPATIYKASYPCWLFSETEIINQLSKDYQLVSNFEALDGKVRSGPFEITNRGFILAQRT